MPTPSGDEAPAPHQLTIGIARRAPDALDWQNRVLLA